ncbi:hypothetical protein [Klebsiella pneumoniae]|uniref:hypothetical protein n=1 Tax=Klebsiella pneumoniae TaxID=573 RepID=UPI00298DEE33|nr:hypothetical protein [Klebsiella pneumoniae]MDW7408210.1 hypothetical protein [Klebsiella pneumoniae]
MMQTGLNMAAIDGEEKHITNFDAPTLMHEWYMLIKENIDMFDILHALKDVDSCYVHAIA